MQINTNMFNNINSRKELKLVLDYSNKFTELYSLDSFTIDDNGILVCTIKIPKETLFQDIPDIGIITTSEISYNMSNKEILEVTIFEIKEIEITKKFKENPFLEYGHLNLPIGWMDEITAEMLEVE